MLENHPVRLFLHQISLLGLLPHTTSLQRLPCQQAWLESVKSAGLQSLIGVVVVCSWGEPLTVQKVVFLANRS